ncbi:MAG: hypothetical protein WB607_26305 [Candidatus Acidiferrum sp.]|jgi:hypothetical protein
MSKKTLMDDFRKRRESMKGGISRGEHIAVALPIESNSFKVAPLRNGQKKAIHYPIPIAHQACFHIGTSGEADVSIDVRTACVRWQKIK